MKEGRVMRAKNFIWREIEGQIVVIKDDGMVIYVLNKTAARIWEMCDGNLGRDEMAAKLCERYDVSFDRASVDVGGTLTSLMEKGLLMQAA